MTFVVVKLAGEEETGLRPRGPVRINHDWKGDVLDTSVTDPSGQSRRGEVCDKRRTDQLCDWVPQRSCAA